MSLLEYLPAIYHDPTDGDDPAHGGQFLRQFLWPFERIMLCAQGGAGIRSFAEAINRIHLLFDAESTPEAFLNWLAGWVTMSGATGAETVRLATGLVMVPRLLAMTML